MSIQGSIQPAQTLRDRTEKVKKPLFLFIISIRNYCSSLCQNLTSTTPLPDIQRDIVNRYIEWHSAFSML